MLKVAKYVSYFDRDSVLSREKLKSQQEFKEILHLESIKHRFDQIYERNLWGSSETRSGPGSELEYTEKLRAWMVEKLPYYNVKKVVDAPCGDFNWMKSVVDELNIEYFGFDIVEKLIIRNMDAHQKPGVKFSVADICKDKLPDCDLLIVRDCLFHLSYTEIDAFLRNIAEVKYRYLLTTTHNTNRRYKNSDIITGDFRLIDLFKAPFDFHPDRILESIDDCRESDSIKRRMILIEKSHVRSQLYGP
jgi:hypothetical protein